MIVVEKVKRKIKIRIADNEFHVVSSEEETYSQVLAAAVDRNIRDICKNARTSVTGAAILSALNYCDELNKSTRELEELKGQLSFYLDELVQQKAAYQELVKENRKLRGDLAVCRHRLREESATNRENEPISPAFRPMRRSIAVSESEEAAEDE